ncbi:AraC family ligand binding domain-containing protein [Paenibacillus oceani]|nr:AraC family ligand binding domain-containing protein [Paenibacillus oceani]
METIKLESHLGSVPKHIGKLAEFGKAVVMQLQLRAGETIPEHRTEADVLIVVQSGQAVFVFQDRQVTLDPRTLLHILPGEAHSVHAADGDAELLVIKVARS